MTLIEAQRLIKEIVERYRILFSDYHEERKEGKIKFVTLILRFKIDE